MKLMYSREFVDSDIDTVKLFDSEGIHKFLSDPFTFGKVVLEDEKGIILVGMRRVINEFKIIPNNNRSNLDIAVCIQSAFNMGVSDALQRCPTEVYVFITRGGEHYVNLLKKHMKFTDVKGIPLKLEI